MFASATALSFRYTDRAMHISLRIMDQLKRRCCNGRLG
jgi:hypothetical protein